MPLYRARTPINFDSFNEGLSALGKAFAPPSAAETLAYTKAAAERESASRLAELYGRAKDPNLDTVVFDRQAGIAGAYAPSQSLTAVDRNNATTLRTNAADNARALQQTVLQGRNSIAEAMAKPVILGDGQTAFLPGQTQAATGLPSSLRGNITLNQGQQATLPGGEVIAGAQKPLSMDEAKAADYGGLPDPLRRAIVFGSTPTPTVSTPDGLRITTAPESLGQAPAPDAAAKPDLRNYKDGDRAGAARFDPAQGWVDAQTGQKLSPNVQLYSSQLQGNAADTGLGSTAKNNVEQQLLDASAVEATANTLRGLIDRDPAAQGILGTVFGVGQDVAAVAKEGGKLFGPAFAQTQKDIAAGLVDPDVAAQMQSYNPNIPQVKLYEMLLAGQVAKMIDPNGRISNERMKQVTESLGGGGFLSNASRTRAALDAIQSMVNNRRTMLRGTAPEAAAVGAGIKPELPGAAPTPAPAAQTPETWVRGPDGKLRRAQ